MPDPDRENAPGSRLEKRPVLLIVLSLLSVVFLVSLALYVRNSFESLEEKLGYQPPRVGQPAGNGAYGIEILEGQTVYVPVYSHVYANGGRPHLLETTLSVRNLDPNRAISVKSVKYFDTNGELVKKYLDDELVLAPLATTEFLVEKQDVRGGSGANFIVVWDAEEPVYEPLIEAVMVGFANANSISFSSPGRGLVERRQ